MDDDMHLFWPVHATISQICHETSVIVDTTMLEIAGSSGALTTTQILCLSSWQTIQAMMMKQLK